jgi:hypothetical protein
MIRATRDAWRSIVVSAETWNKHIDTTRRLSPQRRSNYNNFLHQTQ